MESVESFLRTNRRSIDIVMLITPHIYRSSDSIGGGPRSTAASKRRGDGTIFSHLVKYLGGTSVECSSSAAAASMWVGYVLRRSAGRSPNRIVVVLLPQYRPPYLVSPLLGCYDEYEGQYCGTYLMLRGY